MCGSVKENELKDKFIFDELVSAVKLDEPFLSFAY